jgi:hypothetical protein
MNMDKPHQFDSGFNESSSSSFTSYTSYQAITNDISMVSMDATLKKGDTSTYHYQRNENNNVKNPYQSVVVTDNGRQGQQCGHAVLNFSTPIVTTGIALADANVTSNNDTMALLLSQDDNDSSLRIDTSGSGSNGDDCDQSFLHTFVQSNGAPQIVVLILFLALGFGSTVGVVRENSIFIDVSSIYFHFDP